MKAAAKKVLTGSTWQRYRVHTMRTILTHVPKTQQAMIATAVKTIFAQPSQEEAL